MNSTPSPLDQRIRVTLEKLQKLIMRRNLLMEAGLPCPLVRLRIRWLMYRLPERGIICISVAVSLFLHFWMICSNGSTHRPHRSIPCRRQP